MKDMKKYKEKYSRKTVESVKRKHFIDYKNKFKYKNICH